jgi:hypothetical protein
MNIDLRRTRPEPPMALDGISAEHSFGNPEPIKRGVAPTGCHLTRVINPGNLMA